MGGKTSRRGIVSLRPAGAFPGMFTGALLQGRVFGPSLTHLLSEALHAPSIPYIAGREADAKEGVDVGCWGSMPGDLPALNDGPIWRPRGTGREIGDNRRNRRYFVGWRP